MIVAFLFIGFFAAIIGAIPPGASNLAVIKTSAREDVRQALKIGYGAGLGEVLLAFTAMSFGMVVQDFFTMHIWIQFFVVFALIVAGIVLVWSKPKEQKKIRSFSSKYATGFFLSLINPPVLIYWVVACSMLHKSFALSDMSTTPILLLFFGGVFLGKVITLYGYSRLGHLLQNRKENFKESVNKVVGIALLSIALLQGAKLLLT